MDADRRADLERRLRAAFLRAPRKTAADGLAAA
jgi:hypothetical protein